jgi:hypothetical protein
MMGVFKDLESIRNEIIIVSTSKGVAGHPYDSPPTHSLALLHHNTTNTSFYFFNHSL